MKVLIIGSGPILIGQAAEFDYAGTQACRALREEGIETVLVNSNPTTIMTDPGVADVTYLEPLTVEVLERVIAKERPSGLLATIGGQTGLNLAVALAEAGVLERHGVELLGTPLSAIQQAEDREAFKQLLQSIGEPVPDSVTARSVDEARAFASRAGYPLVIRPAFTLGGTGGGVAHDRDELVARVARGVAASPIGQVLVERSLLGWKETEYEDMSVCAVSKRLHAIANAVTTKTSAAFETALDYVVVKIPRWPFDKFAGADRTLGTQMKATGEVMAIDRSFEAALQKALRSLEVKGQGLLWEAPAWVDVTEPIRFVDEFLSGQPTDDRLWRLFAALRRGAQIELIHERTRIDRWFLRKIARIVRFAEDDLQGRTPTPALLRAAKRMGFADADIATLTGMLPADVRRLRTQWGIRPVYKMVDTCAAEFEAVTPYFNSTYEQENEATPPPRPLRSPRTAAASTSSPTRSASRSRRAAPPPRRRKRSRSRRRSATRCWCGQVTCWAVAVWRSPTAPRISSGTFAPRSKPAPAACSSTNICAAKRSRWTRSQTEATRWSPGS